MKYVAKLKSCSNNRPDDGLYMDNSIQRLSRQRGAFSLLAAATLLILLMFLGLALDTGRLYMEQRRLQKIADMAAMETLLRLPDSNCSSNPANAQVFAAASAQRNNFLKDATQALDTDCVEVNTVAGLREISPSASGEAVQVTATHTVKGSLILRGSAWIGGGVDDEVTLSAVAAAERSPAVAAFTVGAQLLRLDNNKLLGQLLQGVGLDVDDLSVLDADGLANASVLTSGLLEALGIDLSINELKALTPNELVSLVNTEVGLLTLSDIIELSVDLISDSTLQSDLMVLSNAIVSDPLLDTVQLQLFSNGSNNALIQLVAGSNDPLDAALDTRINLGDLLTTSLLAAYSGRALVIPDLNLLGLAAVELGIVEPPSIGIGPVGTQAYNAQIRLYLDVDSDNLLGGVLSWLTGTVLGTRIHLPIWIDLVSGLGTLTEIDCDASPREADVLVDSSLLNVCVGDVPDELKWSTKNSCLDASPSTELVKLLAIPLLTGKAEMAPLVHQEQLSDIQVGQTKSTSVNPLALGNTIDNVVTGLLDLLGGLFRTPTSSLSDDLAYTDAGQNLLIENLASQYLEAAKNDAGFYDATAVSNLILNGGDEYDSEGNQVLPPLVDTDWPLPNSIPTSCLLTTCPVSNWNDGTFSEAFEAYTQPGGLLDLLGISTLGNGYQSCGGLLSALLAWNSCLEFNLVKFLQEKPGGIDLSQSADGDSIADASTDNISCSGALCVLLEPVLELLKPLLNEVGTLLSTTLTDSLGLEIGRTDVSVKSVSCGAPELVR